MSDFGAGSRGFDTGRVVRRSVDVLQRNFPSFLLLSLLFIGLPTAGTAYVSSQVVDPGMGFAAGKTWLMAGVSVLVALLGGVILQATITHGALNDLNGRRTTFADALISGLRDVGPLLLLGVVTNLGIMAGALLLIVPGIILSLAWMVVVPAMVTERLGVMEAIRRSNVLTGNARGPIFGLAAIFIIAQMVVSWLFGLVANAVANDIVSMMLDPALQTLSGVIGAVGVASIYCELRWNKEGTPAESLAEVFA